MTTPAPGLTRSGFAGTLTPAQVHQVLNELIEGAPFAGSLTRANTSTGTLSFPVVGPTGFSWLQELEQVPRVVLNDKAVIVTVAKIIGALPVSSEMRSDASVNITTWVSNALRDSLSRDLDLGILRGTGVPQPDGIIDQAEEVTGPNLIDAVGAGLAQIGEKGGTADTIALSPTSYAAELTSRDGEGRLMHPNGLPDLLGLRIVQVADLDQALLFDATRCFLVLGQDSTVTLHDDWQHDAVMVLVKARANVGVPVAAKSIRKLSIEGDDARRAAAPATPARAQPAGKR